jgi:hypothetical protein
MRLVRGGREIGGMYRVEVVVGGSTATVDVPRTVEMTGAVVDPRTKVTPTVFAEESVTEHVDVPVMEQPVHDAREELA